MMMYLMGATRQAIGLVIAGVIAMGGDLPVPDQVGIATRFGDPGDKWVGGNLFCAPTRRVNQVEHVCAHRLAGHTRLGGPACGEILILENPRTKKRSWCQVMDRGPYGAEVWTYDASKRRRVPVLNEHGRKEWYVKIFPGDKPPAEKCPSQDCVGRWRGYLDMSPAVSESLGHNGFERIRSWRIGTLIDYFADG